MRSNHLGLQGAQITSSGGTGYSRHSYSLTEEDMPSLSGFLDCIMPLLSDPMTLDNATTERAIAYTRYKDALFHLGPSERTITSAITALEALFLKNEGELTRRLTQRVAVFLRSLGTQTDSQMVNDNVGRGYKIRSTFIHGGSLKAKDRPEADSLAPVLLEYARACVLSFFQISSSKDDVLAVLDRVMIEPSAANDLATVLARVKYR